MTLPRLSRLSQCCKATHYVPGVFRSLHSSWPWGNSCQMPATSNTTYKGINTSSWIWDYPETGRQFIYIVCFWRQVIHFNSLSLYKYHPNICRTHAAKTHFHINNKHCELWIHLQTARAVEGSLKANPPDFQINQALIVFHRLAAVAQPLLCPVRWWDMGTWTRFCWALPAQHVLQVWWQGLVVQGGWRSTRKSWVDLHDRETTSTHRHVGVYKI